MSIEKQPSPTAEPKFAFGDSEMERRRKAMAIAKQITADPALNPAVAAEASGECQGFDPYNSSGSFDRKKHWERVGKR